MIDLGGDTFEQAVLNGFAPGGKLYFPKNLPRFDPKAFQKLAFLEIATKIATTLFPEYDMESIVKEAFTFPLPKVAIGPYNALELFHGPTLSFKDIGARFMAALTKRLHKKLTILVATTGDTGSAIGNAFHNQPNTKVYILFPKGGVTPFQEKQITTIGGNVTALQIEGTFDDCQNMVKYACQFPGITTGNSINIARLIPQSFYYFYACQMAPQKTVFSIPSGNFGHLVSGLLAKRMGAPIQRFIAATNINDVVPRYLQTGVFSPKPSKHTIAVSMDVGNPSNFPRLLEYFDGSVEKMRQEIEGHAFTDEAIKEAIREVYSQENYVLDPHSAVAYLGLKRACQSDEKGLFFMTAHPCKFASSVQPLLPSARLEAKIAPECLVKSSVYKTLSNDLESFVHLLNHQN